MSSSSLVDFWTSEQDIYEGSPKGSLNGLRPRAERTISEARAAMESARTSKQKAVADAGTAQQKIATLRARMASDGPTDVAVDADELRLRLAEMHTAAGRMAFFGDMILKLESDLTRATAERDRFVAKSAAAAAALAAAGDRQKVLNDWLDPDPAHPDQLLPNLVAIPARAAATIAERGAAEQKIALYFPLPKPIDPLPVEPVVTDPATAAPPSVAPPASAPPAGGSPPATALPVTPLPVTPAPVTPPSVAPPAPETNLRTAITARWKLEAQVLDTLEAAATAAAAALLNQLQQSSSGPEAQVEGARLAHERDWRALSSFVRTAEEELNRAIGLYRVAASLKSPAQSLRDSLAQGAYHDAAIVVLEAQEKDRNAELGKAVSALGVLAGTLLTEGVKDPVQLPQTVIDDFAKLTAALTGANEAQRLLRPAGPNAVDLWEAALPDEAFQGFVALQEANDILDRLRDPAAGPATLVANLRASETKLVAALRSAASADRVTAFLRDTVAQRNDWLDRADATRLDHLFSAARGDV
jgi:hypothetical protein